MELKPTWISVHERTSEIYIKDIKDFWGNDMSIIEFPYEFKAMSRKDLWEIILPTEHEPFNSDMAWEDFAYSFPSLVRYIEEDIRERIGVNFLKDLSDVGLFFNT